MRRSSYMFRNGEVLAWRTGQGVVTPYAIRGYGHMLKRSETYPRKQFLQ